jgi:hypothetical protein
MSWSFTSIGKTRNVSAEIAAMTQVPQPIKDLVAMKARGTDNEREGLRVSSYGHHGGDAISSLHVEIDVIYLAPEVPVERPPQPPQPEESTKQAAS